MYHYIPKYFKRLSLPFLRVHRPTSSRDDMFNRCREIETLRNILKSTPQLTIITGPVNSGKSLLLEKVTRELAGKIGRRTPVLPLNLRSGTFHSVQSLVNSLSLEMNTWLKEILRSIESITLASSITLQLKDEILSNGSSIAQLDNLLKGVAKKLPPHTMLGRNQIPILFIDEANRLRTLLRDKHGQTALESLFQWFIQNTKEKRRFHVVLASSDSFFHLWVEKFVGSSRYTNYVIGHLDEGEARRYWESKVTKDYEDLLKKVSRPPPAFDDVYSVCGGSVFLMNLYCIEYCVGGLVNDDPTNFSMVLQEERKLERALTPNKTFEEYDPPRWNRDILIDMMKMMAASPGGIIEYSGVCTKFGEDIVNSVIEYNLMHLRPRHYLTFDIPYHRKPVVTPESPAAFAAMKLLLKRISTKEL